VPDAELELVDDLLRDLLEVRAVALGQEDALDAGAVGREDLLLDAADRQHPAAQRDLAGHRDVVAHLDAREQRDERREHRHTGAEGPSFGMAPAGMWMCMSLFSRKSFAMPKRSALVRT
jgi:hypothetical protein